MERDLESVRRQRAASEEAGEARSALLARQLEAKEGELRGLRDEVQRLGTELQRAERMRKEAHELTSLEAEVMKETEASADVEGTPSVSRRSTLPPSAGADARERQPAQPAPVPWGRSGGGRGED